MYLWTCLIFMVFIYIYDAKIILTGESAHSSHMSSQNECPEIHDDKCISSCRSSIDSLLLCCCIVTAWSI